MFTSHTLNCYHYLIYLLFRVYIEIENIDLTTKIIYLCYDYDTLPAKPRGHSHINSPLDRGINVQLPLFWQGFTAQASYTRSQLSPAKSRVQLQV